MSVVNDALKRAKAAHTASAPAAEAHSPHPDPAEADRHRSNEPMLVLLALLILFTVLAGIFAVQIKRHRLAESVVAAPAPKPVASVPAKPSLPAAPPPQTAAVVATNTPIAGSLTPEQPPPAPARLQAIFFDPTRPSAMIGGESLYVGDSLGNFRVAAITRTTVILVSPTRTNVLTLSVD